MRLEGDAGARGRWQWRAGALAVNITAPVAAEPRNADVGTRRVHQPGRWQRAGGDERGEEERKAQAPVHDRSMTRTSRERSGYAGRSFGCHVSTTDAAVVAASSLQLSIGSASCTSAAVTRA